MPVPGYIRVKIETIENRECEGESDRERERDRKRETDRHSERGGES